MAWANAWNCGEILATKSPNQAVLITLGNPVFATGDFLVVLIAGGGGAGLGGAMVITNVLGNGTMEYTPGTAGDRLSPVAVQYAKMSLGTLTRAGATVTCTSAGHGLAVGNVVVMTASGAFASGSFTITAKTTNTFSYSSGSGSGSASCKFYNKDNPAPPTCSTVYTPSFVTTAG